jgi:ABC-type Zn uptake system ZnuABC Zn-binding protein ZnuA
MRLTTFTVLALMLVVFGCGGTNEGAATGSPGERLPVVATTMQLQDFARQVGGDRVDVQGILGPDADPHEYDPRPSDADALASARVVLENGANLDGWLGDLLDNAGGDAQRVNATEGIELLPTEEQGFPGDPHVWHDPDNAKRMVGAVEDGLAAADPAGRATYARNADRYRGRIDAMAARIRAEFARVPPARRKLVTNHDAFGYFARAYEVDVVGTVLSSLASDAEPSARQVRDLARRIRRERVRTIFTEEALDRGLERQVAREAGVGVNASLFADVLGEAGTPENRYIEAELANARAMRAAWGG